MNHESTYSTLTDVLLARSDSSQTVTFIEGQGKQTIVSYSELYSRALARLAEFQARGLTPGAQLILQVSDNELFVEGFWACLLGGIVAVPVSGGNSSEHRHKLFRIINKLDTPGLYVDEQTRSRLADFAAANNRQHEWGAIADRTILSDDSNLTDSSGDVHQPSENDTAFIQFSSGSTSAPKGVVITHKNLMINTSSILTGCQMGEQDRMLSWMPLTHDMGLIGFHLTPVVMNICHCLMPTDVFVRRPGLWLTESAKQRASILCSPNFGYQHLLKSFKPEKYENLDLSCVRLVFNGAEPISVDLCNRFIRTLEPFKLSPSAMYPVYGLAEATLAVSFPSVGNLFTALSISRSALGVGQQIQIIESDDNSSVSFVSVGRPLADVEVQISDEQGTVLADNTTGHIYIRGENVTRGYYREPELNQELITHDGWLNTGDLGFVREGQLYITGRAKDIIFVSGQNVYPHDLEELVLQAGLVERGKLAISSQRSKDNSEESLLVFVLHRGDAADLTDTAGTITRLLGEAAGVRVHAVVPVNRIPKTTSGKIQRFLLVDALVQGEYTPLLQHSGSVSNDIDDSDNSLAEGVDEGNQRVGERLLAICNAEVADMNVAANDNLFELGISSLTLAQIHAAIEEVWPDQVDITDLFDYPTVRELTVFLENKA